MKDATKLKDAYLSGIADTLGAEAMAEAGAMENAKLAGKLGMNAGDLASITFDADNRKVTFMNDSDPNLYVRSGGKYYLAGPEIRNSPELRGQNIANPVGAMTGSPIVPGEIFEAPMSPDVVQEIPGDIRRGLYTPY